MSIGTALRGLLRRPYTTLRPQQAQQLIRDRRAILLDVREQVEWQAGHAPGARHIPLGRLPGRVAELPTDRPIVTACRSGMRSARAARLLARQGHEVYNLGGGMAAWARTGLPVTARRGAGRVA